MTLNLFNQLNVAVPDWLWKDLRFDYILHSAFDECFSEASPVGLLLSTQMLSSFALQSHTISENLRKTIYLFTVYDTNILFSVLLCLKQGLIVNN